jgi:hypothetical protein
LGSQLLDLGVLKGALQLIDVGVEYPVHETNARALVRILVWEFDVDFPEAAGEGCCYPLVFVCVDRPICH